MAKSARIANLRSLLPWDNDKNEEEFLEHQESNNQDDNKDNEICGGADGQQKVVVSATVPVRQSRPCDMEKSLAIKDQMQIMFFWLTFSQPVSEKLVYDQGIDSLEILASLADDNNLQCD